MKIAGRLARLELRLPAPRIPPDADAAIRGLCELLEKHAPIPAGETYTDGDARMDAALDRLHDAGVGIPAGPHTSPMMRFAAVYGMTTAELRAALHERARGDA